MMRSMTLSLVLLFCSVGCETEEVQRLREEVSAAISKGVFGSPLFVVDGEPFWGHDRMAQVDHWLQRGGW